ncbi:sensor histidine kinase [Thermodesulfobacteriota bacterium]
MDKKVIKTGLIVHDLKNPLAIIEAGIISLIKREDKYGDLTEKQQRVLKRVLRNSKIAKMLINDILEVGRSGAGVSEKKSFLISDFIKRPIVEILDLTDSEAAEKTGKCDNLDQLKDLLSGLNIIVKIDGDIWDQSVDLDERKMLQILRNLLNNALKYRKQKIELEVLKDDKSLRFSVCDDGQGIDESYHKQIFECYFQLDVQKEFCVRGHGLGLAGVQILIEEMGGELSLESGEKKGAKFSVNIPL